MYRDSESCTSLHAAYFPIVSAREYAYVAAAAERITTSFPAISEEAR